MAAKKRKDGFEAAIAAIRKASMALPGAWEDHPWGEISFKAANKKIFVATAVREGQLRFSCKLPESSEAALTMFSFCAPTGYGLGKSGWVTATFNPGDAVPLPLLLEWIGESHAAVAAGKASKPRRRAKGG